ncbi:hypothetical protein [Prauserella rugosa]|uniref:hypothetical protein n=1 Tax=Prauserella rugosa TaxID=43354 RepID=UPI0011A067AB|nr:hypothetical protein [Prauserella rugosa]
MTAVAGGGAWWLWTRGAGKRLAPVRDRVPARFHQRAKLGGLLGLLFVALASLITWSTPNIGAAWFILVAGTAVLALPWWKNVEHTIPPKPDEDTREPEPEPESEPEPDQLDAQHQRIMGILTAWENRVATSVVPGSTITAHEQNAAVESYRIVLDSDRDMVADEVSGHIKKIAMKLGVMQDKLSFEPDEVNPAVVWMRHVVATPSYDYTGPIVYANGKIVHSRWEVPYAAHIQIVVGHFVDGTGHAVYDLAVLPASCPAMSWQEPAAASPCCSTCSPWRCGCSACTSSTPTGRTGPRRRCSSAPPTSSTPPARTM